MVFYKKIFNLYKSFILLSFEGFDDGKNYKVSKTSERVNFDDNIVSKYEYGEVRELIKAGKLRKTLEAGTDASVKLKSLVENDFGFKNINFLEKKGVHLDWLRQSMKKLGYSIGTGSFSKQDFYGIIRFQIKNRLGVDGLIGEQTFKFLEKRLSEKGINTIDKVVEKEAQNEVEKEVSINEKNLVEIKDDFNLNYRIVDIIDGIPVIDQISETKDSVNQILTKKPEILEKIEENSDTIKQNEKIDENNNDLENILENVLIKPKESKKEFRKLLIEKKGDKERYNILRYIIENASFEQTRGLFTKKNGKYEQLEFYTDIDSVFRVNLSAYHIFGDYSSIKVGGWILCEKNEGGDFIRQSGNKKGKKLRLYEGTKILVLNNSTKNETKAEIKKSKVDKVIKTPNELYFTFPEEEKFIKEFGSDITSIASGLGISDHEIYSIIHRESLFTFSPGGKQHSKGYMQLTTVPFIDMIRGRGFKKYAESLIRIDRSIIEKIDNEDVKNSLIYLYDIYKADINIVPAARQELEIIKNINILKNNRKNSYVNLIFGSINYAMLRGQRAGKGFIFRRTGYSKDRTETIVRYGETSVKDILENGISLYRLNELLKNKKMKSISQKQYDSLVVDLLNKENADLRSQFEGFVNYNGDIKLDKKKSGYTNTAVRVEHRFYFGLSVFITRMRREEMSKTKK